MAEGPKRPSLGEEEQCRVEQSSFSPQWLIWVCHISDTLHYQISLVRSYFSLFCHEPDLELMTCCWSMLQTISFFFFHWFHTSYVIGVETMLKNVFMLTPFSCCPKEKQMSETSCETNTEGKQRHLVGNLAQWSWTANSINISLLACLISYVDVILNTQSWTHLWLNISYIMFVK